MEGGSWLEKAMLGLVPWNHPAVVAEQQKILSTNKKASDAVIAKWRGKVTTRMSAWYEQLREYEMSCFGTDSFFLHEEQVSAGESVPEPTPHDTYLDREAMRKYRVKLARPDTPDNNGDDGSDKLSSTHTPSEYDHDETGLAQRLEGLSTETPSGKRKRTSTPALANKKSKPSLREAAAVASSSKQVEHIDLTRLQSSDSSDEDEDEE